MKFLKKVSQPITKNNLTRNNDYEIKTFTTNLRNRSPVATNSYYPRRSPMKKDQRTIDSGAGEMVYVDPNEVNFRHNDEPSQMSNNYIMRSPGETKDEQLPTYRNEYERSQIETSQQMGYTNTSRIPQFSIDIEKRREKLSRSPKTINIGESAQEAEYNIRTLRGRSPRISRERDNSSRDNPVAERSYNLFSETGNIFLDQPMQQGSFVRQNEIIGSPGYIQQNSYEMKNK